MTGNNNFLKKKFSFSNSTIEDFYLNIKQYQNEKENSLVIFLNDLKEKLNLQNPEDLTISINKLKGFNGKFYLSNLKSKTPHNIEDIEFTFDKINFQENNLIAALTESKFTYELLKVESFKSKIEYLNHQARFNQLKLLTRESQILGNVIINLKELNSISIDGDLNQIKVSSNEISRLLNKSIEFSPLNGSLQFNGKLDNIKLSKVELRNESFLFSGSSHLKNIFDSDFEITSNINSLYFSRNGLSQALKLLPKANILEKIKNLGDLNFSGSVMLNSEKLTSNLFCLSEKGNIITSINADLKTVKNNLFFDQLESNLKFENFDIGDFIEGFGEVNGSLNVSASGPISNIDLIKLKGYFNNIKYFSKTYSDIKSFTRKTSNGYENRLTINDRDIKLDLSLFSEYKSDKLFHNGLINLKKLDMKKFYLYQMDDELDLSGKIYIDYSGNQIDKLSGILNFQDFKFLGDYTDYKFTNFSIENFLKSKYREIEIKNSNVFSGKIYGDYYLSNFKNIFSNFLGEIYYPLSEKEYLDKQDLSFEFRVDNDFIKTIYPITKSNEEIKIEGKISTVKNNSRLDFYMPFFSYNDLNIIGLNLKIDTKEMNYPASILVDEIITKEYSVRNIRSLINKSNELLNIKLSLEQGENFKNQLSVNSKYSYREGTSFIQIDESEILFKNNLWKINSNEPSTLSYNHADKKFLLDSFKAKSNDEEISFSGGYFSTKDFDLSLNIDNVSIDKISPDFARFKMYGKLNSSIELKRSITNNTLKIVINADDFQINDDRVGNISILSSGNTQMNSYGVELMVENNNHKSLTGKGSLLGIDMNPRLDIDLKFNEFNLDFLSPIGKENIKNIRGEVTGDVNLWGPLASPYHTGELVLNNSGLRVNYINADYKFIDNAEISLVNQSFNLKSTKFIDTKFKTQGFISGEIEHVNFKNWNFDLKINSEKIMMVDIPKDDDAIFYGNGFFKGDIVLSGPSKNLNINVKGETQEGTIINIPWAEDYGIIDPSFIDFKDKSKLFTNLSNETDFKSILGLEMDFELDIDSDAEIAIVIDSESGSFLKGKGGGNILMEINTQGKFNIWGDYIVSEGIYNFKNLSLIDKKFTLKPGGTIGWEGDPYSAIMNIEAIYKVPGGANPALLLDNPNFNKKIPTDVIIKLQGNLLRPDDPIFQINFPNASGVVKSEINYRLSDPQISQLQAISLLSQGIFISEVSVSMQGITNNLYEKASDIFSNLIGGDEGKFIFGVNYLQGDKSEYLDLDSENRLGLTLSTQITDKILINGEIGVPFGGVEETLIVGDVQIDFILNEDGSLKAKVFNRENEFRYIGDELGYTQGVGVSYEVDFETFSELISKIIKRKK